jgi:hypothetical protein
MNKRTARVLTLTVLWIGVVAACSRHGGSPNVGGAVSSLTEYTCGGKTYRVPASAIDGDLNRACEAVKTSLSATEPYTSAEMVRFTCQRSDGHVVESLRVGKYLLDDYDRACKEYLAADASSDQDVKRAALRKFIADSNVLSRKLAADANDAYRQKKADVSALEQLIKERGGSIEIGGTASAPAS